MKFATPRADVFLFFLDNPDTSNRFKGEYSFERSYLLTR